MLFTTGIEFVLNNALVLKTPQKFFQCVMRMLCICVYVYNSVVVTASAVCGFKPSQIPYFKKPSRMSQFLLAYLRLFV